jgi:hypothetical protein
MLKKYKGVREGDEVREKGRPRQRRYNNRVRRGKKGIDRSEQTNKTNVSRDSHEFFFRTI